MNRVKQLYELQEVDLDITAKSETLEYVRSCLGESQSLVEARSALERERERLAELESEEKAAEWVAEDLRAKSMALEERLYGGSIRSPRELGSLQQEVEHLKARCKQQEDKTLDIMSKLETAQGDLKLRSREAERVEREWREEQERLLKEQAELGGDLVALEHKRSRLVSQIDSVAISIYETLLASKQGRAVAKVEQGMCKGCRVSLPMNDLQQARTGQELVQCSNCGRILYVS